MQYLREDVAQGVRQCANALERKGELLSQAQLNGYYSTFRQRFGPDVFNNLDGEVLLMTMHARGNTDSLVYWLEFKNDEEFPAIFGGIAGGSAFNYDLFFSQEKQTWITGSPNKPQEISLQEAIQIAHRQRDELLVGAQVLSEFPNSTDDADYQKLQSDLQKAAPTVQDSAWGHKYFSLLFPDKLDDYHSPAYGRFHLIKLLQLPPIDPGRYVAAGRFVAISEQLNLPINNITTTLNALHGRKPCTYWRIGTTIGSDGPSVWDMMMEGNCVAIGWSELGDLSPLLQFADKNERKTKIKDRMRTLYGSSLYHDHEPTIGNQAAQINAFLSDIANDDVVVAMDGATVVGIGKVAGKYYFNAADQFPHQIPVEWLSHDCGSMSPPEQLRSTVRKLGKYPQHLVEIETRVYGKSPIIGERTERAANDDGNGKSCLGKPEPTKTPAPSLSGVPARIQSVLERKGQVILYGPPGTGKTYWAENAARELAARSWFGKAFQALSDADKATINAHAVRMCCFHPSYGYEDFLEGYRPELVGGEMVFQRRDGVFKRLCYEAEAAHDRQFYLIIDEINRGDIPRIFGELLTVMEKNKRGTSILLPLSGQPFRVPSNINIIGTMNTADRAIAMLDAALRRRFGFIELMPDSSLFGDVVLNSLPLRPWLDALNRSILDHIGRDGRNIQIGHSYFLNDAGKPVADFATFSHILEDDVLPLLEEYCYEDYRILESILGSSLIDVPKQRIRQELFAEDRTDDLVTALKAPFPSVATAIVPPTDDDNAEMLDDEADEPEPHEP